MYDPRFHKLITSKDEESRELMVGIGLGGGTLHFGLQYIDQIDILQTSSEFKSDEFKDILLDISNINQTKSYDYDNMPIPLKKIKDLLDSSNMIVKNNKIYSRDLVNRFSIATLLEELDVNVIYGADVNQLLIDDNKNVTGVTLFRKKILYPVDKNTRVILCAGAIESCCILQRSGIGSIDSLKDTWEKAGITQKLELPVGEQLFDHAGSSLQYLPMDYAIEMQKQAAADKAAADKAAADKAAADKAAADKAATNNINYRYYWSDIEPIFSNYSWSHGFLQSYEGVKRMANKISYRINLPESNWRSMPKNRSRLPEDDRDKFEIWKNDGCPYSKNDLRLGRINNFNNLDIQLNFTRAIGPAWTRGEIEAPAGTKDMGTWTAAVYTKEQQERLGVNEMGEKIPTKLQEVSSSYIGHLQTRDISNNWQTYYSLIPNPENDSKLLPLLVVTHAQAGNLSGKGKVHIDFSGNTTILNKHNIKLNHFTDVSVNDIYDCFIKNYNVLMNDFVCTNPQLRGWVMNDEKDKIIEYLKDNMNTIYHYHGSNPMCKVVDINQQILDLSQVYIGDISVLTTPIPGSTSVSAMVTGYRCANKIYFEDFNKNKKEDIEIIKNKMNRLLNDDRVSVGDCVKEYNKNKSLALKEFINYTDRLTKVTICDVLEHSNRITLTSEKTINLNHSKNGTFLELDDIYKGYTNNKNINLEFIDNNLKINIENDWKGKAEIYLYKKTNHRNIKIKTQNDKNVIKINSKKIKRCGTCEKIKRNRELKRTSNIVSSLITSDRRRGPNINYYLKEDEYDWQWPNSSDKFWSENEKHLIEVAFKQFENVTNLKFNKVDRERNAQIIIHKRYMSNLGAQVAGDTTMGSMYSSNINIYFAAYTSHKLKNIIPEYPTGGYVGGWDYITILHEIAHGLGLGHPHDSYGGSSIMSGVSNYEDIGYYKTNQFPFTIMSYFDIESSLTSDTFWNGFMKTLGPIDIAAIQLMYGKNKENTIGDNIYYLPSSTPTLEVKERVMSGGIVLHENAILIPKDESEFTSWETINDTGGIDVINAENVEDDVNIDLNSSLVEDILNGGISMSNVINENIKSGLIVGKNSVIENVVSGKGNDVVYENTFSNEINGNKGYDTVHFIHRKNNYLIIPRNNNEIHVVNTVYSNDVNVLKNIEKIVFHSDDNIEVNTIKSPIYPNDKGYMITIIKT